MIPIEIKLPVTEILEELKLILKGHHEAILQAPPGAGKTTLVPLALAREPWLKHKKILMLEPRRIATRAAAQRMADLLQEPVGQTVGYRMRLDTRVSSNPKIEVITEGILTRMLQEDPPPLWTFFSYGSLSEYNATDRVRPRSQLDPRTGKSLQYMEEIQSKKIV